MTTMGADLNSEAIKEQREQMEILAQKTKKLHPIEESRNAFYAAVDAQSQTIKADAGKEQLRLVPMQILRDIARIREYGNKKYGDSESWKQVDPSRYHDAMLRHAIAFIEDPLSVDEESGLPHLHHLACNVSFLCEFYKGELYNVDK